MIIKVRTHQSSTRVHPTSRSIAGTIRPAPVYWLVAVDGFRRGRRGTGSVGPRSEHHQHHERSSICSAEESVRY